MFRFGSEAVKFGYIVGDGRHDCEGAEMQSLYMGESYMYLSTLRGFEITLLEVDSGNARQQKASQQPIR